MRVFIIITLIFLGCQRDKPAAEILSSSFPTAGDTAFSFNKIKTHKATAIVFLSPECPLCQNYSLILNEISQKYKSENILLVGAIPGDQFAIKEIKSYTDSFNITFPIIIDKEKKLLKRLKAHTTPEVFLTDSLLNVLYSGRVDNWAFAIGQKRTVTTEHNLIDAIEAVISNKEIKLKKTKAIGCLIE